MSDGYASSFASNIAYRVVGFRSGMGDSSELGFTRQRLEFRESLARFRPAQLRHRLEGSG